jgi:hypothetical protein
MGAIATSGQPRALDLFRKLLLASAAIPRIFPPVLIDVELNGGHYQELHVDGGAVAQMFLYPPGLTQVQAVRGIQPRPVRAWLIRNSRLDSEWASVRRQTLGIAQEAISEMIQAGGNNDVLRIYFVTMRDHVDYNLAWPLLVRTSPSSHRRILIRTICARCTIMRMPRQELAIPG